MSIKVQRGFNDGLNFLPMPEGNVYRVERKLSPAHTAVYEFSKEEAKELHSLLALMLYL